MAKRYPVFSAVEGASPSSPGIPGIPTEGLQLYTDVGDRNSYAGSGTTLLDLSSNKTEGSMSNITVTEGHFNFNASTSRVEFANVPGRDDIFSGTGGTVLAWARAEGAGEGGTFGRIISSETGDSSNGWGLLVRDLSANALDFAIFRDWSGTNGNWETQAAVELDYWYFVGVTYDSDATGNVPTLYVNGKERPLTTITTPSGSLVSDAGNSWSIGTAAGARTWDGDVDMVMAYDRILTEDEITQIYNVTRGRFHHGTNVALRPPQITANQDDYAPAGWGPGVEVLFLDTDASRTITGLDVTGISDGYRVHIVNTGSNNVVLADDDVGSSVINRFHATSGANITLTAQQMAIAIYDENFNGWITAEQ